MRQPSQQVGVPLRPDGLSHNNSHGRPRGRLNRLDHPHRQHGHNRHHPFVVRLNTEICHHVLLLCGRHALNLADRPTDNARRMLDPTRPRRTRRQRHIPSTPDRPALAETPSRLLTPSSTSGRTASNQAKLRGPHPSRPTKSARSGAAKETHKSSSVRERHPAQLPKIRAARRRDSIPPSLPPAAQSPEPLSLQTALQPPDQNQDESSPATPATHGSPKTPCPRNTSVRESHVSGIHHPQTPNWTPTPPHQDPKETSSSPTSRAAPTTHETCRACGLDPCIQVGSLTSRATPQTSS